MASAPPCLPPREVTRPMVPPFELFQQRTPDPAARERILVADPAKLYGLQ